MSIILGIDPGHKQTAWLAWSSDKKEPLDFDIVENEAFLSNIGEFQEYNPYVSIIEGIQSFGMPVGKEVFETVFFIGRLWERLPYIKHLVYRKDIKMHFCQTPRAKDGNIRQALIDRFGSPGTKKDKGILYGISKDVWSALAISVYWDDINA
jgi:hypothetical protein